MRLKLHPNLNFQISSIFELFIICRHLKVLFLHGIDVFWKDILNMTSLSFYVSDEPFSFSS